MYDTDHIYEVDAFCENVVKYEINMFDGRRCILYICYLNRATLSEALPQCQNQNRTR